MTIYAIVYAKGRWQALKQGRRVFSGLCQQEIFDYYETVGECAHGATLAIVTALSSEGKDYLRQGLDWTRDQFRETLTWLRRALASFTDDELFEDKDNLDGLEGMFRSTCNGLGSFWAHNVWLFDHDGAPLRNTFELERALRKGRVPNGHDDAEEPEEPYAGLGVWVVPADVHF